MTVSTFYNHSRDLLLRVFLTGNYAEGAQIISRSDDALGRKPDELTVEQLNKLWFYWEEFGDYVEWRASPYRGVRG
jgi:hypothetical protein